MKVRERDKRKRDREIIERHRDEREEDPRERPREIKERVRSYENWRNKAEVVSVCLSVVRF